MVINDLKDETVIDEILRLGIRRTFSKGESVFQEGERASSLPIVSSGKIKVFKGAGAGKEVILRIFEEGEMFAIPPVFEQEPFPASAGAMTDAEVLFIQRPDFLRLVGSSSEFAEMVFRTMSNLLHDTTRSMTFLAIHNVKKRVASVLAWLASKDDISPYIVKLRRQDVAQISGITTESAIRNIKKLADDDLLKIKNRKIVIDDLPKLKAFADS